jgi:cation-transporting P-type ATPase G
MLGVLFSPAEGAPRCGLRALFGSVPPTATVLRNGTEVRLSPNELVLGDRVVLRPGKRAATTSELTIGSGWGPRLAERSAVRLRSAPERRDCRGK